MTRGAFRWQEEYRRSARWREQFRLKVEPGTRRHPRGDWFYVREYVDLQNGDYFRSVVLLSEAETTAKLTQRLPRFRPLSNTLRQVVSGDTFDHSRPKARHHIGRAQAHQVEFC